VKVLFVAAEVQPFAKTGGLADVAGTLPVALARRGLDVRIFMPKYRTVSQTVKEFATVAEGLSAPVGHEQLGGALRSTNLNGVPVYFLEHNGFFDRDGLYGHYDDLWRYTYFCRMALAFYRAIGWRPDVIHCNDWHTGLIPLYLKRDPNLADIASIYTIHNLAYPGSFEGSDLYVTGVEPDEPLYQSLKRSGSVCLSQAGITCADLVTTVSERYAQEIQTPEFGAGFDALLSRRRNDLYGVLNGIDYEQWNPRTDATLAANYSADDLSGKQVCKRALQRDNGLPECDLPVIAVVSRLAAQKGFDLIEAAAEQLFKLKLQFVLLGTGEERYHRLFRRLARRFPDATGISLGYSAAQAHRLYAGADMFLMPSRYEPCGLGQMISMAYGTIPIVRSTGGLADTVRESGPEPNGFVFRPYAPAAMIAAIRRALQAYADKRTWNRLVANAFASDFGWGRSAARYEELYELAMHKRRC